MVCSRTALSEKKPTVKAKSPEKSKPDEKDPEKSPTKKQEGTLVAGEPAFILGTAAHSRTGLLAKACLDGFTH